MRKSHCNLSKLHIVRKKMVHPVQIVNRELTGAYQGKYLFVSAQAGNLL